MTAPNGTTTKQDVFGTNELAVSAEVQAQALMAQAEAEVKARWAIAQRNPRNIDSVRVALLKECERPGFADVAKYSKPVGGTKIVGPSIRFVEAALRCMGNVIASTTVVSEDRQTRRIQVMVTDLENNISWPRQITLEKTVERKYADGREIVGKRLNTNKEQVFIVLATEDEFSNKEGAAVSKAIRVAGLRVIPGDLIEEAMAKVDSVRSAKIKADPQGERKKLVDAFVSVGVTPVMLTEYLGHSLDICSPVEIGELRDIFAALRDGETRWAAVMDQKREADPVSAPPAPATQTVNAAPVAPATPERVTKPTEVSVADFEKDYEPVPGEPHLWQKRGVGPSPRPTPAPAPNPSPPTAAAFLSTREGILAAIKAVTRKPDLNKLASAIGKLTDEADKAQCMAAYAEKAKELS